MPHFTDLQIRWYDLFFVSMLISNIGAVVLRWHKYWSCENPLNVWIVVDYSAVLLFRCLMFVDAGIVISLDRTGNRQDRWRLFRWRLLVLIPLVFVLYPFLCFWTVTGSMWFRRSATCLGETGQSLGYLVWIFFCYCSLLVLGAAVVVKWAKRRKLYQQLMRGGHLHLSELRLAIEMLVDPRFPLRFPNLSATPPPSLFAGTPNTFGTDSVYRAHGRDGTDGAFSTYGTHGTVGVESTPEYESEWYFPTARCTPEQHAMIERSIQQLPKYSLKNLNLSFTSCTICLEDFDTDIEVRPLPCAHVFHVKCIDSWLRLNVRCPQCRSDVFPNLGISSQSSSNSNSNTTNNGSDSYDANYGNTRNSSNGSSSSISRASGSNASNNSQTNSMIEPRLSLSDNPSLIIAPLDRQNIITIPRISVPLMPRFTNLAPLSTPSIRPNPPHFSSNTSVSPRNRTPSMTDHPLLNVEVVNGDGTSDSVERSNNGQFVINGRREKFR